MNLGFITWALLYGEGDFGKTITSAVNCGMDTDCVGATSGAFLGILLGSKGIPQKWKEPAGNTIVYSDFLSMLNVPKTIDELTDRVVKLSNEMSQNLETEFKSDLSITSQNDPIDDGYEWLVITDSNDYRKEPAQIAEVVSSRGEFSNNAEQISGIHINLDKYCLQPRSAIYLFTYLKVPTKVDGYLMLCADTGITVWLDSEIVLNYHGRDKAIPACHRVQGGASIPVKLEAGISYALKVRLIFCFKPLMFAAAVLDKQNQYVNGFEFTSKP
jgi:hypothetical protein